MKEAIVLAGGFGTRLAHVVPDVPKPMAPVCGKPFLSYILSDIAKKGIERVVLAVGYKKECIECFFGNCFEGMGLVYSPESEPLLTGGAIRQAAALCAADEVFVMNGDTFFDVDLPEMLRAHQRTNAVLTVATKRMADFDRYGTVETDRQGRIVNFREKTYRAQGKINGGIYLLQRQEILAFPEKRFSFEKDYMERYVKAKRMYAFCTDGYFIDIGIPEDYARAQEEFAQAGKSSP